MENVSKTLIDINISQITTEERRIAIQTVKRMHLYLNSLGLSKLTPCENYKNDKKDNKYKWLTDFANNLISIKRQNDADVIASHNSQIISLAGAASSNARFGLISKGTKQQNFNELISSLIPNNISEAEKNEYLRAMLQTTVELLNELNFSETAVKNALLSTVNTVTTIKNKYGKNINEDLLGKVVQDEIATNVLNNLNTGPDFCKCKEQIINKIGNNAWNKMTENSQIFIVQAKVLFTQMSSYKNFDYSVICIAASKALEVEVSRRYCGGLIKYIGNHSELIIPSGLIRRDGSVMTEDNYMFGNITDSTGYYIKEGHVTIRRGLEDTNKTFLLYASQNLLVEKQKRQCEKIIQKHISMIDKVRIKYRNPAAHKDVMLADTARECLNYLVDVEHTLGIILDDCEW